MQRIGLNEIKPNGWLKEFLKSQRDGLTGYIEKAGYPFNVGFWKGERFEENIPPWEVFEQTAYWIDGAYCCAKLLDDEALERKADSYLSYVVENADEDGFIGPDCLRQKTGWHRWPHVVLFRALMAKYSVCKDESILLAIKDFYLKNSYDYSLARDFLNIEIMLWAYGENGDSRLLALAEKTYEDYQRQSTDHNNEKFMLSKKKPYSHGVTYLETSKIGAILYLYTKNEKYLNGAVKAFEKVDKMFLLADGGVCSDEFVIDNDYMQCHETCTVSDYTWALSYLLMATGDVKYADKIEKCIFNAGIGSVNEEFTALQYLSCVNQVLATEKSSHPIFYRGKSLMQYAGKPFTECCTGNVNRFMPNYCRHLWMQEGNKLFATLYGANVARFTVNDSEVVVNERTEYPFNERIIFEISTGKENMFELCLRIPAWSKKANLYVNGTLYAEKRGGRFARLKRTFKDGDKIELELFATVEVSRYQKDGVVINRGPLTYAFGMYGNRRILNAEKAETEFPKYEILPDKEWNYGLDFSRLKKSNLQIKKKNAGENVWTIEGCPYYLEVPAVQVKNWKLAHRKKIVRCLDLYEKTIVKTEGDFTFMSRFPNKKNRRLGDKKEIVLVPFGVAKMRVTVFPEV